MSQGNSAVLSISAARGAIRSRARVRTSSLISRCSAVSTSCGTARVSQGDLRPAPRSHRRTRRSGAAVVPDRLDVVAVGVEQVGAAVAGVVLRAFAGTAVVATAGEQTDVVEGLRRLLVSDAEREVQVAGRPAGEQREGAALRDHLQPVVAVAA